MVPITSQRAHLKILITHHIVIMKFPTPRLWIIEKEIIELRNNLPQEENDSIQYFAEGKHGYDPMELETAVRISTSDTRTRIEVLELERKFIIDRQNNLFWKIIWNIIVPIIVSITTVYFTTKI